MKPSSILRRPAWDEISVPDLLADGIAAIFGERLTPDEVVRRILADVRARGDAALLAEGADRRALHVVANGRMQQRVVAET